MGKLDDIKKQNQSFRVPEGYFDNLTNEIVSRKNELKEENPSYRLEWSLGGLATAVAMVLIIVFFIPNDSTKTEEYLAEVSDAAIIDYLAMQDLSTDEIISTFGNDISFGDGEQFLDEELDLDEEAIDELYYQLELESEFDQL